MPGERAERETDKGRQKVVLVQQHALLFKRIILILIRVLLMTIKNGRANNTVASNFVYSDTLYRYGQSKIRLMT